MLAFGAALAPPNTKEPVEEPDEAVLLRSATTPKLAVSTIGSDNWISSAASSTAIRFLWIIGMTMAVRTAMDWFVFAGPQIPTKAFLNHGRSLKMIEAPDSPFSTTRTA